MVLTSGCCHYGLDLVSTLSTRKRTRIGACTGTEAPRRVGEVEESVPSCLQWLVRVSIPAHRIISTSSGSLSSNNIPSAYILT